MSKESRDLPWAPTRRDFLTAAGVSALQLEMMWSSAIAATPVKTAKAKAEGAHNILLILNDQERYQVKLIASEIGEEDGSFLGLDARTDYAFDKADI